MKKQSRKRINSLKTFKFTSLTQTMPQPLNKFPDSQSIRLPQVKRSESKQSPGKFLPTVSQHRQSKKKDSKDLSTAISKFTHYYESQDMRFSEQLIRSAVNVIKGFSQVENNFQQLFTHLYISLKRFLFVQHEIDILNKYSMIQGVSFRKLALSIDLMSENFLKQKEDSLQKLSQKYNKIRIDIDRKESLWKQQRITLEEEVQKYKKMANIQYVKGLQRKIQILKEQISEKIQQYTFLVRQNQLAYQQISEHKNSIENLKNHIVELKQEIYKLHTDKEGHQKYLALIKDRFDDLQAKMAGIKDMIEKVATENETLVSERTKLVNRAAVGFQELTPRPKYKEILNQIDFKKGTHLKSTEQIISKMLEECQKNLEKDRIKDILFRKRQSRLADAQKILQKVEKQIQTSKNQLPQF